MDNREQFWINYFNSKNDGYNLTTGGEAGIRADYDLIISLYKQEKNAVKVAKLTGYNRETIIKAITLAKIKIPRKKKVCQIDKFTGQIIKIFPSIAEASRVLKINESSIGAVCKGKRKTAGGYIWRYILNDLENKGKDTNLD